MFDFLKPKKNEPDAGGNRAQRRLMARFTRLAKKPRIAGYGKPRPFETPGHWQRRILNGMKKIQQTLSERNELSRETVKLPNGSTVTLLKYSDRQGRLRVTKAPGGIARFVMDQVVKGRFDRVLEGTPKVNKPRPNRVARKARRAWKKAQKAFLSGTDQGPSLT
jgi:hypothetical protein